MKNVTFLLRGNISKQAFILVTERFRCRCLASGQYRYQRFVLNEIFSRTNN